MNNCFENIPPATPREEWISLMRSGNEEFRRGNYRSAESSYKNALSKAEEFEGCDPHLAATLSTLAWFYRDRGRHAEAVPFYAREVQLWQEVLGADHPSVAASLEKVAEFYDAQANYHEAEVWYRKALAIRQLNDGASNLELAHCIDRLADVCTRQGNFSNAEILYKEELKIIEPTLGAEHPGVAAILFALAGIYTAQGNATDADTVLAHARAIWTKQAKSPMAIR